LGAAEDNAKDILIAWMAAGGGKTLPSDHALSGKDPEKLGEYLGKAQAAIVKAVGWQPDDDAAS
jgi:hypothetical protein